LQLLGEVRPANDLYALGRLLAEARGRPVRGPLHRLITALVEKDWRKRPASAAVARARLRPSVRRPARWLVPVLSLLALGGGAFAWRLHGHAQVAPPPAVVAPRDLEEEARILVHDWMVAQNQRRIDDYAQLYADPFIGVRRTSGDKMVRLDRAAWIADRTRIFQQPLEVAVDDLAIKVEPAPGTVKADFIQRFRRGKYSDHGFKRLLLRDQGGMLRIAEEEMIISRPGWDEPAAVTDRCPVSFDPSGHAFVIARSHLESAAQAEEALWQERAHHHKAELVWGPDLGLESGYWVLLGVADEGAKAEALAARWKGEAHAVTTPAATQWLRLVARVKHVGTEWTVDSSGIAYTVHSSGHVRAFDLRDSQASRRFQYDSPVMPVKVALHEDRPYVLGNDGHWSLITPAGLAPGTPFDPSPNEGREVSLGDVDIDLSDKYLRVRQKDGEALAAVELSPYSVFALGARRVAVLVPGPEIMVFDVGPFPSRLTKVCGIATSPSDASRVALSVGEREVVADDDGLFELWTGQTGWQPLEVGDPCPGGMHAEVSPDGDSSVPLFQQQTVLMRTDVACEEQPDDDEC
jgi:hypothetical protein